MKNQDWRTKIITEKLDDLLDRKFKRGIYAEVKKTEKKNKKIAIPRKITKKKIKK